MLCAALPARTLPFPHPWVYCRGVSLTMERRLSGGKCEQISNRADACAAGQSGKTRYAKPYCAVVAAGIRARSNGR